MKRALTVALLASLPAAAAITAVRYETTATQAIVRYSAPDSSACTVEISESPTYTPLVHDVNGTLFSDANLDSRPGNITLGQERVFVAGKRAAEKALNGKFYSRALQAGTTHYLRITCGSDTATDRFQTTTIPLGNTYGDPLPYDPNDFTYHGNGRYAWPTLTGADGETVIDPLTGALLKRITKAPGAYWHPYYGPGPITGVRAASPAAWGASSEADMLTRITTNDTSYLTYASASQDQIALVLDGSKDVFNAGSDVTMDYLTVSIIGWGAGATAENRKVQFCLTIDGVTCYGPWQELALPASDPGTTAQTTATTQPFLADWTTAGSQPPGNGKMTWGWVAWTAGSEIARRNVGTVAISGATVTASNADAFTPSWTNGSRISITGGTGCPVGTYTISSVTDDKTLTLTTSPGNAAACAWTAFNVGLILRKKTATTDQITIDQIVVPERSFTQGQWTSSGSEEVCEWGASYRSGVPGYHCVEFSTGAFYWISSVDAQSYLLGTTWYYGGGLNSASGGSGASLDPGADGTLYSLGTETATGKKVVVKWVYTGSNLENVTSYTDGGTGGIPHTTTNLTPGARDFYTLVTEFEPKFDGAKWGCSVVGVMKGTTTGLVLFRCLTAQDALGFLVAFDPALVGSAAGCVGGGNPGCVIGVLNPMRDGIAGATNEFKWCGLHYTTPGDLGWSLTGINPLGRKCTSATDVACGPYLSVVTAPVLIGASSIVVASEPYDPNPAAGETGAPGEYANVTAGDYACLSNSATDGCGYGTHELVKVTSKSGTAPSITLNITRAQNGTSARQWTGSVYLTMFCHCTIPNGLWWDALTDPHGDAATGDAAGTDLHLGAHIVYKDGVFVQSSPSTRDHMTDARLGALPGSINQPMTVTIDEQSTFAGYTGTGGYTLESHPNWGQTSGTGGDADWFVDTRPTLNMPQYPGVVNIDFKSGYLYTLTVTNLSMKRMALSAQCGPQTLKDVSSATTGNVIATDLSTPYQICIANKVNECRTGSTVGKVYINCPYNSDTTTNTRMWVSNVNQGSNGLVQLGLAASATQQYTRTLTYGLARYGKVSLYASARPLPNGKWVLFQVPLANGMRSDTFAAKSPPWPDGDSVDRRTFVPLSVPLGPAPAGANNVIVEFGYDTNFYCTSRHEACVATGTGQVSETTPFYWASESFSGLPCASGCTLTLPAVSQRVVYYRWKYRAPDGSVVSTSETQMAVSP